MRIPGYVFFISSNFKVRTNESIGILSWEHILSTILHLVQISLAYILMLIVMTFNTWLCLAVVIGSTLGYFLIGWKKPPGIDVSDHCHWLDMDNGRSCICRRFPTIDISGSKRIIRSYLNTSQRRIKRWMSHTMRTLLNIQRLFRLFT